MILKENCQRDKKLWIFTFVIISTQNQLCYFAELMVMYEKKSQEMSIEANVRTLN